MNTKTTFLFISIILVLVLITGCERDDKTYLVHGYINQFEDYGLSGVSVSTYGEDYTTLSDESGFYELRLPRGAWLIEFKKDGYITEYKDIELNYEYDESPMAIQLNPGTNENDGYYSLLEPQDSSIISRLNTSFHWRTEDIQSSEFRFQLSLSEDFQNLIIDTLIMRNSYNYYFYNANELQNHTTYYWRIKAKTHSGVELDWSDSYMFTIERDAPFAHNPYDHAMIFLPEIEFEWYVYNSLNDGNFHFELSTTPDFSSEPIYQEVCGESPLSYTLDCQVEQVFYWRVCEFTSSGFKNYSDTMSFTYYPGSDYTQLPEIIEESTTLTASQSPYYSEHSVFVEQGAILSIEPGVRLIMGPSAILFIDGALEARGTEDNSIILTSSSINESRWSGITFTENAVGAEYNENHEYTNGSIIEYCDIYNIARQSQGSVSCPSGKSPYFSNIKILDSDCGLYVRDTDLIVKDCYFEYIQYSAISYYSYDGNQIIIENSLFRNSRSFIDVSNRGATIIENNVFENTYGDMYHNNGSLDIETGSNSSFSNNILRNLNDSYSLLQLKPRSYQDDYILEISNNHIYKCNTERGISLSHSAKGVIQFNYNLVQQNTAHDIFMSINTWGLERGSISIFENTFINNSIATSQSSREFELIHVYESDSSSVVLSNNNFINPEFDFELSYRTFNHSEPLNALSNYWGVADEESVKNRLLDLLDSSDYGQILYSPFLTEPSPDAPPIE